MSGTTSGNGLVRLTSTTAPNKVFGSREELAAHYKSDWHKYNCKRKEAGLPLLEESEFQARLEAALALKREREAKSLHSGTSHLKKGKERKSSNAMTNNSNTGSTTGNQSPSGGIGQSHKPDTSDDEQKRVEEEETAMEEEDIEEAPPTIDPCQSLFDSKHFQNVVDNVKYMQHKYGFFVPDAEYLVDVSRLIGYCHEKIIIGQMCLYCQRGFKSPRATRDHMVDAQHCKIRYEDGVDLWEYEPFYDFSEANDEFWKAWLKNDKSKRRQKKKAADVSGNTNTKAEIIGVEANRDSTENEDDEKMEETRSDDNDDNDDDDSTEWEDVTDDEEDEEMEGSDEDDDDNYTSMISHYGFDVTPYGELILPDGRVIGHRALSRYYKQKLPAPGTERAAVRAARLAAATNPTNGGYAASLENGQGDGRQMLRQARRTLPRDQQGVLVRSSTTENGGSGSGFTTLSLYRHQALIKKSRREEAKSRRLMQRHTLPMNKMDKKGNRLMNNVSVAHAPR